MRSGHILFVVEYYYPHIGGGEIVFQQLAEGLAARGISVDVVTCLLPATQSKEQLNGVTVHRIRLPRRGRRHWFTLFALPKVLRLIRPETIVQTTTHNGAFPAWLGARLRRVPAVMTVHEVFGSNWANLAGVSRPAGLLFQAFESVATRLPFDWQVCVSEYTQRKLSEYYPSIRRRSSVVYNGVDYRLFDPATTSREEMRTILGLADRFVILYFGRPGYSKGLDYLIDALPAMRQHIADFLLVLLLADEPRSLYDNALSRLQSFVDVDQVRVLSPVTRQDLPSYLAAADCVTIPSLSEGFGLSAAEACAMDRPVVATTGGALPEVVSGRHVLIPPRDAAAIAAGVLRVHAGTASISPKKTFPWSVTVQSYMDIYASLQS